MELPLYRLIPILGTISMSSLMLALSAGGEPQSQSLVPPPRKIAAEVTASRFYNLYPEPIPQKAASPECSYFTIFSTWNYQKNIRLDSTAEQVSGTAALTGELIYTAPAKYTKATRIFGVCDNSQKDLFDELAATMEQDTLDRVIVENPLLGVYECLERKTPTEPTLSLRRDYLQEGCGTLAKFNSSPCVEMKTKLGKDKKDYNGYVCHRLEPDRSPIFPEEGPELPEEVPGC